MAVAAWAGPSLTTIASPPLSARLSQESLPDRDLLTLNGHFLPIREEFSQLVQIQSYPSAS